MRGLILGVARLTCFLVFVRIWTPVEARGNLLRIESLRSVFSMVTVNLFEPEEGVRRKLNMTAEWADRRALASHNSNIVPW